MSLNKFLRRLRNFNTEECNKNISYIFKFIQFQIQAYTIVVKLNIIGIKITNMFEIHITSLLWTAHIIEFLIRKIIII